MDLVNRGNRGFGFGRSWLGARRLRVDYRRDLTETGPGGRVALQAAVWRDISFDMLPFRGAGKHGCVLPLGKIGLMSLREKKTAER